jgi:hypothetical protein
MTMKKENEGRDKAFKEEGSGRNSREATSKTAVGWWIASRWRKQDPTRKHGNLLVPAQARPPHLP